MPFLFLFLSTIKNISPLPLWIGLFLFVTFQRIISLECLELLSGITRLLDG
ncbi:hypothetical protein AN402_1146 [Bacillus wiedmannii]|nr:hypothetical protein AN402_1146 [Bacillus wiedmannii]